MFVVGKLMGSSGRISSCYNLVETCLRVCAHIHTVIAKASHIIPYACGKIPFADILFNKSKRPEVKQTIIGYDKLGGSIRIICLIHAVNTYYAFKTFAFW